MKSLASLITTICFIIVLFTYIIVGEMSLFATYMILIGAIFGNASGAVFSYKCDKLEKANQDLVNEKFDRQMAMSQEYMAKISQDK